MLVLSDTGKVSQSPFLEQLKYEIDQQKTDERPSHDAHPSLQDVTEKAVVSHSTLKPRTRGESHHVKHESVFVLDEAHQTKKGIDYWEKRATHAGSIPGLTGVDGSWWQEQLKTRHKLRQQNDSIQLSSESSLKALFTDVIEEEPGNLRLSVCNEPRVHLGQRARVLAMDDGEWRNHNKRSEH